jgi:hypothetical protein
LKTSFRMKILLLFQKKYGYNYLKLNAWILEFHAQVKNIKRDL